MNQIFSNGILNLNINSSLQYVLDNCIPEDTALALINHSYNNGIYNFDNRFSVYNFPEINKSVLKKSLTNFVDYFIIFNKNLNEKHYKIINNLLVNDKSIILVECEFNRKKLQEEIGRYEFFKIDRIELKEKIKLF
tara:strand:- start:40 stop:447 length:408 start_codon:yes stop_codon:yes gene_type:complete